MLAGVGVDVVVPVGTAAAAAAAASSLTTAPAPASASSSQLITGMAGVVSDGSQLTCSTNDFLLFFVRFSFGNTSNHVLDSSIDDPTTNQSNDQAHTKRSSCFDLVFFLKMAAVRDKKRYAKKWRRISLKKKTRGIEPDSELTSRYFHVYPYRSGLLISQLAVLSSNFVDFLRCGRLFLIF